MTSSPRLIAAVFRRELAIRRLAFAAAAVVGVLPVVAPWLPGAASHGPAAVRQAAFVLVLALTLVFAPVGLGVSLLRTERLGFDLARPIPARELWLGTLAAAVALLVGCLGLAALPTLLVDAAMAHRLAGAAPPLPLLGYPEVAALSLAGPLSRDAAAPSLLTAVFPAMVFAGAVVVTLAAHVAATFLRVRSAWLLLDVALVAIILGLVALAREVLLSNQAHGPLTFYELFLLGGFALALAIAGWPQLRVGRSDPARSRRALALAVWPALLAVALAGLAYAHRAATPGWGSLDRVVTVEAAPGGGHLVVSGRAAGPSGVGSTFLVDLEDGDKQRLDSLPMANSVRFSGDGRHLYWLDCRRLVPTDCEVMTRDLAAGTAPRATGIDYTAAPRLDIVPSPEGDVLVEVSWRRAAAYRVGDGQLLGAVDGFGLEDVFFLGPREILLAARTEGRTRFERWDVDRRVAERVAELPGEWSARRSSVDRARRRVFYSAPLARQNLVVDLRTGETIADLARLLAGRGQPWASTFLADGRLLLVVRPEGMGDWQPKAITFLRIDPLAPDAAQGLEADPSLGFEIVEELAPGQLLLAGRHRSADTPPPGGLESLGVEPFAGRAAWVLDTAGDALRLRPLAGGLEPLGSHLFRAAAGAVVRWDVQAGSAPELALAPPGRAGD